MRFSALFVFTLLLHVFFATSAAQNSAAPLPHCALACANAIPDASNQSHFCADTALQTQVQACVKRSCTVKENLTAQNITANTCRWPYRDRSWLGKYGTLCFFVFATTAVAARITSRMPRYSGPLGPDDYVMIATWVLLATYTALIWIVCTTGIGKDIWTLTFDNITITLKYYSVIIYIYILLAWTTKISILFLYLRLFPDLTFRNIVKTTIVLYCLAGFAFFMGSIFRCIPVDLAWNFWDHEHKGRCTDILHSALGWPHVSVNIFADLFVIFLPLPTIWKLNLPLEKKLGVIAMFSIGLFVTAVSIYRATVFPSLIASTNFSWDWLQAGLWSAIEIYVGVVCACMPGIRAFYTQVFPGRKRKALRSGEHYTGSTDPSSLGTVGSRIGNRNSVRRDDEYGLILSEPMELMTPVAPLTPNHYTGEYEEETKRLQLPK